MRDPDCFLATLEPGIRGTRAQVCFGGPKGDVNYLSANVGEVPGTGVIRCSKHPYAGGSLPLHSQIKLRS